MKDSDSSAPNGAAQEKPSAHRPKTEAASRGGDGRRYACNRWIDVRQRTPDNVRRTVVLRALQQSLAVSREDVQPVTCIGIHRHTAMLVDLNPMPWNSVPIHKGA